jgi:hypothetical protein
MVVDDGIVVDVGAVEVVDGIVVEVGAVEVVDEDDVPVVLVVDAAGGLWRGSGLSDLRPKYRPAPRPAAARTPTIPRTMPRFDLPRRPPPGGGG